MDLPLPLDQLRFNVVLRVLITAYWIAGVWNFMAFIPWCSKDEADILWYKDRSNYSFWLLSSLLFFLLWISQFQYPVLICISIAEIYLIIVAYFYLIIKKWWYSEHNKTRRKQIGKRIFSETSKGQLNKKN